MALPGQPEINIGVIGHVDHGKTSLVKLLTGKWTDTHSEEIKRGISIKLGYADAAFYKCSNCTEPACYCTEKDCPACGGTAELARIVSFVDSPGHETLMATMLSGAAIMDGALLLVSANEACPQPQTKEHLMALEVIGVKNIVIVQSKIDLVDEAGALKNYEQIKQFVKGTCAETSPVIPVSALRGVNIDLLIQSILSTMPVPTRDYTKPPRMFVVRSFNINRPGVHPKDMSGGVIGGSLIQGSLSVGDEIEIRPGLKIEESNKITWKPIVTIVRELIGGGILLKKAKPGGLIAISTGLDPALTKSDSLVGQVVGKPGTLPEVWNTFTLEVHLLERVVGMTDEKAVEKIKTNEPLMLNVGSATTVAVVTSARNDEVELKLKLPVCAEQGQRVALSRRIGTRWRLIGYGVIR